MPTMVSVKITTKILKFYSFPMNFHNFIRCMLCKIPQIYQKIYLLPFSTILLFICLPLYLWKLQQKSSKFDILTLIPIIYSEMIDKKLQFYQKISPLSFSLIYSCICMPFLESEILSKNLQFYHYPMLSSIS